MKRAVVLSGGGAKGAYEIGVWKALRRLSINYDIVCGTSVGALNGVLMVQKDYFKALKLWYYMDYSKVIDIEIKKKYASKKGKEEILGKYAKGALKGGLELSGLSQVIDKVLNKDKFFKSNINYGLVTTHFPSLRPKLVKKGDLTEDDVKSYMLASASCFPAFKPTKIGKNFYIDGGYYDNMPINFAISMGADEVIAVDLKSVGIVREVKDKNVKITYITPKNDLGSFLAFEKDYSRKAISFGYNDTMKVYKMLDGNIYTFKKGSLDRNYKRMHDKFNYYMDLYLNKVAKLKFKKITLSDNSKYFNDVLENTLKSFNIDESKIYRASFANVLIKKEFLKCEIKKFNTIKKAIKNNSLKKAFVSKELICYIHNEIEKENKRLINDLAIMFPNAFLCALYIKTIER